MFKNALVSVSNKKNLSSFITPLSKSGMRVVSTGGTSQFLKKNGIEVVEVSQQTGFPEMMDGRVRTLHPYIHMGLLARSHNHDDMRLLQEHNIEAFDLVVVNLYPFEEALSKNLKFEEMIEFIDIGGPSLLRAASKNFERIAVVCEPEDYQWILNKKELTYQDRKLLAAKAFQHVSRYDQLISNFLNESSELSVHGELKQKLRYGENPQQEASWYKSKLGGLHDAQILQGKELSYNNILDLDAAIKTLYDMGSRPSAVGVKHNSPCGVAIQDKLEDSIRMMLEADPVSIFGGIVACNQMIDQGSAKILSSLFLECVIAPDFSSEALEIFSRKKNMRVLKWKDMMSLSEKTDIEVRSVSGGFLMQTQGPLDFDKASWKYVGEKPNHEIATNLEFAMRVCAHLKSNAIAIVSQGQTVGLGMGQVNRVDAVEQAIQRKSKFHINAKDVCLASDAFFPFPDSIEIIAQAGIKWIIQPGGSVKDTEVIDKAKSLGVNMILTGQRYFRH